MSTKKRWRVKMSLFSSIQGVESNFETEGVEQYKKSYLDAKPDKSFIQFISISEI